MGEERRPRWRGGARAAGEQQAQVRGQGSEHPLYPPGSGQGWGVRTDSEWAFGFLWEDENVLESVVTAAQHCARNTELYT